MDAEQEMLTSDGLGAALKAELRDVKKPRDYMFRDAKGEELNEGDEVWLEGYSEKEGRGILVHESESDGYLIFTVFFHEDDGEDTFTAYVRHEDDSAYFAEEFEKR